MPPEPVCTSRVSPVSSLVTTTETPGRTAPDVSVTLPPSSEVPCWAGAGRATAHRRIVIATPTRSRGMGRLPSGRYHTPDRTQLEWHRGYYAPREHPCCARRCEAWISGLLECAHE